MITILDRAGLERVARECYALITDEYERAMRTPLERHRPPPDRSDGSRGASRAARWPPI
jgi:hypothetical protein